MEKTTVYLERRQARALRQMSRETGRSVAELIRIAIDELKDRRMSGGRPRFGLFDSGVRDTARRAEEILAEHGFGCER